MSVADPAWFEAVLQTAACAGVPVADVSASLWEGGVRVALTAAGAKVGLDVHARREGPAYATTASFTVYLRASGLPAGAEEAVRGALAAVRAADPGGLVLPKGEELPEDAVAPELRVGGAAKSPENVDPIRDWMAFAADLPARLREAAGLAWGAHRAGEAYPFADVLGPVSGDDEALRAWVLARWPDGFSRDDFGAAWGEAGAEALMRVLGPLRAIGVAELGDDGVRFHPGVGGDVAIHAVLLWSPEVTEAARRVWGGQEEGARARLDAVG